MMSLETAREIVAEMLDKMGKGGDEAMALATLLDYTDGQEPS